jgi:hypothetical protein
MQAPQNVWLHFTTIATNARITVPSSPRSSVEIRGESAKLVPMEEQKPKSSPALYCPRCALEVSDPLTCGDCSAVICRICGTPLESSDELGIG